MDPDDYGGTQIVMAVTAPGNKVFTYIGLPTDPADAFGRVRLMTSPTLPISLDFPARDLSGLPGNARFQGHHRVLGTLKIW